MSIIFERDFAGMFTEVVNKYMAKGMTFHVNSMSGSQGEKAKVDLTDGKDVYRIRLESDYASDDEFFRIDTMSIIVERHDGAHNDELSAFDTIWNGKGEEVERIDFYKLDGMRRANVYTDSLDYAKVALKKSLDRYKIRKGYATRVEIIPNEQMKERLKKMCKEHKGYGKMKADNIKMLEKRMYKNEISYTVYFLDGKESLRLKKFVKEA